LKQFKALKMEQQALNKTMATAEKALYRANEKLAIYDLIAKEA
jgi:hypothetical protein